MSNKAPIRTRRRGGSVGTIIVQVPVPIDDSEVTENNLRHSIRTTSRRATLDTTKIIEIPQSFAKRAVTTEEIIRAFTQTAKRAANTQNITKTAVQSQTSRKSTSTPTKISSARQINRRSSNIRELERDLTQTAKRAVNTQDISRLAEIETTSRKASNDPTIGPFAIQPNRRAVSTPYVVADVIHYADTATSAEWQNPPNAEDNDTATFSDLTATSSGIGGLTSNDADGILLLSFDELNIGELEVSSDVVINIERHFIFAGALPIGQSGSVTYEYRVDGGAWINLATETAAVSKSLITSPPITLSKQEIDDMEIRAVGDLTSGSGSGSSVSARVFRVWREYTAEGGVIQPQPVSFDREDLTFDNANITFDTLEF